MMKSPSGLRALQLLVAFFGSTLMACGSPVPGSSCSKPGYDCMDKANALECRDGAWVQLPCRGPGGCSRSGSIVSCDMSADLPGDACASAEEGQGLCSSAGTAMYECRSGTVVQTRTCSSCSVSSGQVVCEP